MWEVMNMGTDDIVVGLDLGSGKVCTVIGELGENDQIEIIGSSYPISKRIY
jgi:cell division ATPase FtsA